MRGPTADGVYDLAFTKGQLRMSAGLDVVVRMTGGMLQPVRSRGTGW
jgi:hypothetical protein